MNLFGLLFQILLVHLCGVCRAGSASAGVRYKHIMMNKTWRHRYQWHFPWPSACTLREFIACDESLCPVAGCNHISSLNNKRPLCWRLSVYTMTWLVSGVFGLSVPLILFSFFSLYPPILSVQLFCTLLFLWKGVMHLESDCIPSMLASSPVVLRLRYLSLTFPPVICSSIIIYVYVCPLVELLRICLAILSILHNEGYLLMQLFAFGFVLCISQSFLSWLVQYLYSVTDV